MVLDQIKKARVPLVSLGAVRASYVLGEHIHSNKEQLRAAQGDGKIGCVYTHNLEVEHQQYQAEAPPGAERGVLLADVA